MLNAIRILGAVISFTLSLSGCLLDLHNEERQSRGIPELIYNSDITVETRRVAQRLATNCAGVIPGTLGNFHSTEGQLVEMANRALGQNSWRQIAENIAVFSVPEGDTESIVRLVHDSYMSSPGHRANILNPAFDIAGEGWAYENCNSRSGNKCTLSSSNPNCHTYGFNATLFVRQS